LVFSNRGLFALIILAALDERTIAQAPRTLEPIVSTARHRASSRP
jgi:hypothetical protein